MILILVNFVKNRKSYHNSQLPLEVRYCFVNLMS